MPRKPQKVRIQNVVSYGRIVGGFGGGGGVCLFWCAITFYMSEYGSHHIGSLAYGRIPSRSRVCAGTAVPTVYRVAQWRSLGGGR